MRIAQIAHGAFDGAKHEIEDRFGHHEAQDHRHKKGCNRPQDAVAQFDQMFDQWRAAVLDIILRRHALVFPARRVGALATDSGAVAGLAAALGFAVADLALVGFGVAVVATRLLTAASSAAISASTTEAW